MDRKKQILKIVEQDGALSGQAIADELDISRQAVHKYIKELCAEGLLVKRGNTRGVSYELAGEKTGITGLNKKYKLKNLQEDGVFREVEILLNLHSILQKKPYDLFKYAFTELLNNAIDHSKSKLCKVSINVDQYDITLEIRDNGIGLFYSLHSKLGLKDEHAALAELLKGKITTMREKHTGEGLFFTSKSGDLVTFRSHNILLTFDNKKNDVFVEKCRFLKGTKATFKVSRRSRRDLGAIFEEYAPEEFDYKFERTRVRVKLFHEEYISRSEAKRLLNGLERFKEVILDFKGVKSIGQGFADELFRVFANEHPKTKLTTHNLDPVVGIMVQHVVDNNK